MSRTGRAAAVAVLLAGACSAQDVAPRTEADILRGLVSRELDGALKAAVQARAQLVRVARSTAPAAGVLARREAVSGDVEGRAAVVGATVSFELSRANARAREAAGLEAGAADAVAGTLVLEAACEVRHLLVEMDTLERRVGTLEEERDRIALLRAEAQRRAQAGEDAPFEAQVLQAEESMRELPLPALRAELASARAALRALTGVEVAEVPPAAGPHMPRDQPALAIAVDEAHPRLRQLRAATAAAAARTRLARASHAARLDLFGAARHEGVAGAAGEGYELEVGVTLPSRALRRAAIAAAIADERGLELELARARRDVQRGLAAALATWSELDAALAGRSADASLVEGAIRRHRAGEGSLAEVIQVLALDRETRLARAELESAARAARVTLDCASAFLTAPDLRAVLEETIP